MIVVNLYGGPGSGKTTSALGITYRLKSQGIEAEYVPEYAKQLVYENRTMELNDQFTVTANQYRSLQLLKDAGVPIAVTDSPILLGLYYAPSAYHRSFPTILFDLHKSFKNIDLFIERPSNSEYSSFGRLQSAEEAKLVDEWIHNTLSLLVDEPHYVAQDDVVSKAVSIVKEVVG